MTSNELKTQLDSLFADNSTGQISAADLRQVTSELLTKVGGMAYYENTAGAVSVTGGATEVVHFDGLGANTYRGAEPYYITENPVGADRFSFAEIPAFSVVHFRMNLDLTTTANNQTVKIIARGYTPEGTQVLEVTVAEVTYKAIGDYNYNAHFMAFNNPVVNGGYLELLATSAEDCSVDFKNALVRYAG